VLYLDELLDWANSINFNTYHWNMLHGPESMSIACLPNDAKEKIINLLKQKTFDPIYSSDINNVIAMMENGKPVDIKYLLQKLSVTDRYRKEHLRQTHHELAAILNYGN
jgi:hypothetical protein